MTLPFPEASIRSTGIKLNRKNGEEFYVSATVDGHQQRGWNLNLEPFDGKVISEEDYRLQAALRILISRDALIASSLGRGKSVSRFIPPEPSPQDTTHKAVELLIPLLLDQKVNDSLYAYQRQGVAWLLRNPRAILGDDMGLGKTAQALGATRRLIRHGRISWAMVVCPRTLVANWAAETKKWAPELSLITVLPPGNQREDTWLRSVGRAHIVVTSYEQFRKPAKALLETPPGLVIADEAHRLRKIDSQATQGFRQLRTERFWALTGTPVERDPEDLAVLLSLIDPLRFSSEDKSLHISSLRSRLRPYILRRLKDSVLSELPAAIETNEVLELTENQRAAYSYALRNYHKRSDHAGYLPLFNELRSICDIDPKTGSSAKLDRIVEVLIDIQKAGEKAVVFSYTLKPLNELRSRLQENNLNIGSETIVGEMSLEERGSAIERFKSMNDKTALLASTRVASEGLTLTEANHVIFINRWWNPSANSQARDRVVRIGQTRTVSVRNYTQKNTVEESLDRLLARKSETFENLINVLSENPDRLAELIKR